MKVLITSEAYRRLYEATPEIPGDYISSDRAKIWVDFESMTLHRFGELRLEGEDLSATIIRLCDLAMIMKGQCPR